MVPPGGLADWLAALGASGAVLLAGALWWLWRLRERRAALARRKAGRQLIDSVKAYAAWMDCQRDEPFDARSPEDLALPQPLRIACEVREATFPELGAAMLRLLRSHRAMMDYLWEQNLLRISQAGASGAVYGDPKYQALRDDQDAAIDSVILQCRRLIGDDSGQWHRTRSDFLYSSGLSLHSHPGSR